MIIARVRGPDGQFLFHGSCEILGSPAEDDYRQQGWFPVQSFNFGTSEAGDKKKANQKPTGGTPAGKSPQATTGDNKSGSGDDSGEKDAFTSMELSKEVDRATCSLMVLAMQERSKKHGRDLSKGYQADIHVLGSFAIKDSIERHMMPSIMIHMEGVHIVKWGISGSGDGRPTENISLRYDRAAMYYYWTGEGTEFQPSGAKGWDQSGNCEWPGTESEFPLNEQKIFGRYLAKF